MINNRNQVINLETPSEMLERSSNLEGTLPQLLKNESKPES
jgi:hypothetical protein